MCFNDEYKNRMQTQIADIIQNETDLTPDKASELAAKIKKGTGLKDILEYSRSVHAEMDAITTVARKGGITTEHGYLYTTTYPCHNCARHIIAAGISKVFYIEPYEKSLARTLHRDALEIDTEKYGSDQNIVEFLHFEGISPRQYQNFFYPPNDRKDGEGKAIKVTPAASNKIIVKLLDDYRDIESRVIAHIHNQQGIEDSLFEDPPT
jgi:deoxycytidylate deaminase